MEHLAATGSDALLNLDEILSDDSGPLLAHIVGRCDAELWGLAWEVFATRQLEQVGFTVVDRAAATSPVEGQVLLLRAGAVLDARLLTALALRSKTVLLSSIPVAGLPGADGAVPIALSTRRAAAAEALHLLAGPRATQADVEALGLETTWPEKLCDDHVQALRKREPPVAALLTESNARTLERVTFDAAYKGVTDIVTKYVWPRPAFSVTRRLAQSRVQPNTVTAASLVCSVLAFAFFANGFFIAGLAAGFLMAFLDTVDGKLARVTHTASRIGNRFDHGIDLVAPPFWWLGWWLGLTAPATPLVVASLWIVLGGHLAGKLVEQAFISTFGFKVHVWRPFDSTFRLIAARRNANLVILAAFTVFGSPAAGYLAVAVWITFGVGIHGVRYLQALSARRRGEMIRTWLEVSRP